MAEPRFTIQHRSRRVKMTTLPGGTLGGEVDIDKTFIGGKARNMHKSDRRRKNLKGGGPACKAIVLGMLEREGKVRATVIPDRSKPVMQETFGPTLKPVRRSTPMKLEATGVCITSTRTRSGITPKPMLSATSIPTHRAALSTEL